MKFKVAFGILALSLTLTLAACGGDDEPTKPNFTPDSTSSTDNGNGSDTASEAGPTPDSTPTPDTPAPDISAPAGTVKSLQLKAEDIGCDSTAIETLAQGESLAGVIVTSPKYDAFTAADPSGTSLDGYFIRDAEGDQYNGIYITIDRSEGTDYKPGDVLDLSGELVEYYCQTQLSVQTHSLASSGNGPTGIEAPPAQVASEPYEGVLVTVKDVQVTDEPFGGVYTMTGGFSVTYGFEGLFLSLDSGKTYDITGVVFYEFGEYRLRPRSESDIVDKTPATGTTIEGMQTSDGSVNCSDPGFTDVATGLTLEATVAVGKFEVSDNLDGYIFTDETGGPNSGVFATVQLSAATDWAPGTKVRVQGKHMEFYCSTQFVVDSFEVLGTDGTVPAPTAVTLSELAANPEPYEGTVVELTDVSITEVNEYNEGNLDGSGIVVDDTISETGTLVNGTTYSTLTGVITYGFSTYRVSPRSAADMMVGGGSGDMANDAGTTDTSSADTGTTDAGPDAGPDAAADGGN